VRQSRFRDLCACTENASLRNFDDDGKNLDFRRLTDWKRRLRRQKDLEALMRKLIFFLCATSVAALMATASVAGAQVLSGGGGLTGSVGGVTGSASGGGYVSPGVVTSRVHGTTDTVYHKAAKTGARAGGAAYSAGDAATDTAASTRLNSYGASSASSQGASASSGVATGGLITTRKSSSKAHGSAGASATVNRDGAAVSTSGSATGAIRRD
jgi:hypothetical protein